MKFITKLAALGCLAVLLWTCSEDFLETPPQGSLNEQSLADENGINLALIAAYSRLDGWAQDWGQVPSPWGMSGSNWIFGSVVSDDAQKGSEPTDGPTITNFELFQWSPSLPALESKFLAVYDGVRRANETIRLIQNNEDLSEDTRQQLLAEARFLRGHFHFEAWKVWENIPFIDETVIDTRIPNDQDITPLIIDDLTFAGENLASQAEQAEDGRATSGAAYALLGRLHMMQRNFAAASAAFDRVTGYELTECFQAMFSIGGENGPEKIFSIQASVGDGIPDAQNGNFADRLTFPHSGSPFGCCGFHQPTQNLVNAYRVDDDGLPLLDDSSDDNPTADEAVDPRLDWTVGRDGIDYLGHGTHAPDWIRDRAWSGQYSPRKFVYAPGEGNTISWNPAHLNPVNVPIIRWADVLLMQAEIDVENNRLEDARAKVNMIRERAGNCAQGEGATPVALDDPSTRATYRVGTYDDAWTDQNAAREAVRLERRLELALEGHRWFDLRRYGTDYAINTMNTFFDREQNRRPYMQNHNEVRPFNMVFPIPTSAILTSQKEGEATLTQNTDY